jgi:uncharacterized protein (TIGR03435 family)
MLWATLSFGQTLEFEAASVKALRPASVDPSEPGSAMPVTRGGPGTSMPGRIRYSNVTLMGLVMKAYDLNSDQVTGPGWITEEHYLVEAVVPAGATPEQFRQMLQRLLVERFKLVVLWEEKDLKVYTLTVASGGAKLKASAVTSGGPDDDDPAVALAGNSTEVDSRGCPLLAPTRRAARGRDGCTTYVGYSMRELAQLALAMAIKYETGTRNWAHVMDETGLSGRFDFSLAYDFGYHMLTNSSLPENIRANLTNKYPVSIFKAVEAQLGLKLEAATAKLKVMVIQKAERRPEEN